MKWSNHASLVSYFMRFLNVPYFTERDMYVYVVRSLRPPPERPQPATINTLMVPKQKNDSFFTVKFVFVVTTM